LSIATSKNYKEFIYLKDIEELMDHSPKIITLPYGIFKASVFILSTGFKQIDRYLFLRLIDHGNIPPPI